MHPAHLRERVGSLSWWRLLMVGSSPTTSFYLIGQAQEITFLLRMGALESAEFEPDHSREHSQQSNMVIQTRSFVNKGFPLEFEPALFPV